jgi:hypothetical protein
LVIRIIFGEEKSIFGNDKDKFFLAHDTKEYRGSRGVARRSLKLGTRWRGVRSASRPRRFTAGDNTSPSRSQHRFAKLISHRNCGVRAEI